MVGFFSCLLGVARTLESPSSLYKMSIFFYPWCITRSLGSLVLLWAIGLVVTDSNSLAIKEREESGLELVLIGSGERG